MVTHEGNVVKTIFLDFETYYDSEYSLKKMTPVQYILDPRFEAIGCAVKEGVNGKGYWIDGPDLQKFFDDLDREVATVTFNALFDNCIFAWRFGYSPKLMIDMLGVARACLGAKLKRLSLANVAMHLGIGVKGDTVQKVSGMSRAAIIAAGLYEDYKAYSILDNDLCAGIYEMLVMSGQFPLNELLVMDNVLRCAVEPIFVLDRNILAEHLNAIQHEKNLLMTQAMLIGASGDKTQLVSNEQFAQLLRSLGVDPPTKKSPVTGRVTYAFSKTDPAFVALAEHENPAVQTVVSARLGHKSTLEETRAQRLLDISNLTWPGNQQALMPMPLRFSGAHTHRLSGDWRLNVQNLPARGGKNTLRRAFTAPPGYTVFAVDSSQIEARIVAWLCKQQSLIDAFAAGKDVYSMFASDIFGRPITNADKPERFIGKTGILGLGFGVGWPKFQATVKIQSKEQTGVQIILSDEEAQNVVRTYRSTYPMIPLTWRLLEEGIQVLAGNGGVFRIGPCEFDKGEILLPNGMKLFYHDLKQIDGQWLFTYAGNSKTLYGGKLLENIVQALARIVVMDAAVRIRKRIAPFKLQVHDELVYVVRNELIADLERIALEEMKRRPTWAPELPLDAEAGQGPNYGECK